MAAFKCFCINNIVCQTGYIYDALTFGEVDFVTTTGRATDITKLTMKNQWDDSALGLNFPKDSLLDGVVGIVSSRYIPNSGHARNFWFYYQFDEPQELVSFGLAMKADIEGAPNERWTSFDIQAGDSFNSLETHQHIECSFPIKNPTSLTYFDVNLKKLNINDVNGSDYLNVFSADESGSLSGLVTQGKSGDSKMPLKAEVLLYDRMTHKLMQRTWSSSLGAYRFDGLDAGREYYAVSIHPNRTYNAAIQDGLKSGMTT
ncbi:hypothetical protein [Psychrobacter sp. ANT_WB68]|uniref:hypothetical protein n=1 Tax=Psychrobacter sp. ANT_WB68 TaxID=2597355 RepID=UPI0011F22AE7|nr:hypothetical protein [Psychrobacter sp. ANT_WB68]KAA0915818.1 hypothetical protein FQ084_04600 [Psychrobacter sp. ANT_WB68]